jgi:alkane 1-monooxygenase
MNPYKYLILLVIPATVISGYLAGGYYTFLTPVCCFVFLPLLELFPWGKNSVTSNKISRNSNKAHRFIPFLFVPIIMLLVFAGSIIASLKTLSPVDFFGLMLSVGVTNGAIGFTLAHEFIHKYTLREKTAGHLLLACSMYLHYSIEHVHGHHVYACTPRDPNSAKKGESFYAFFFRSLFGSYKNAWRIESKRLKKNHISFFSINNRMLLFLVIQLTIVFVLAFAFGINSVLFFVGQAFFAVLLHQQVNYMQHYGLTRKDNGVTSEKMHAHHAWGIPGECKIVDLFQVQNHADHHMHASTPYEKLVAKEESPTFPANYATMMIVSLIPPLWFKIIDKRLPSL